METTSESKIENFIESLKLPQGIASVLFESEADCHTFFENFYNRNKYVIDDLEDFRDWKISQSRITFDIFKTKCYNGDIRKVFQSTFYQSITESEMDRLSDAIVGGKISLEQLFGDFHKNPHKNILKNVL